MSTPDEPPISLEKVASESRRRRRRRRQEAKKRKVRIALVASVILVATTAVLLIANRRSISEELDYSADSGTPVFGFEIIHEYPHDRDAFTQGLIFLDNYFYESTGIEGESSLRKVEVETGRVVRRHDVPRPYFAEGLTEWGYHLIQLTYTHGVAFTYDLETFAERSKFKYSGQGWGLTHNDTHLIMSDGSATLRFLDPTTHKESRKVQVTDGGKPITLLNELEYVKGDVYANVWHTDRIAVIEPSSGHVREWVDLTGLNPVSAGRSEAVLNGIAFDSSRERLFVTGKWWQSVYEIRVRRDDDPE